MKPVTNHKGMDDKESQSDRYYRVVYENIWGLIDG